MNGFFGFIMWALIAVAVQNFSFTGATDTSFTLTALRRSSNLAALSALVSFFALLTTLTIYPFDAFLNIKILDYMPVRGLLVTLIAIAWYFIAGGIMRKIESLNKKVGKYLAPAAINGTVMTVPLLLGGDKIESLAAAMGMAVGAGGGFALAAWLIGAGMRRLDNPDISKNMQGAPSMLIYIGLLALAFSAFGGV